MTAADSRRQTRLLRRHWRSDYVRGSTARPGDILGLIGARVRDVVRIDFLPDVLPLKTEYTPAVAVRTVTSATFDHGFPTGVGSTPRR